MSVTAVSLSIKAQTGNFTAGSSGDTVARPMANEMSKTLGQPVVLDFKPGANGVIGIEYVLNQPADGYVIALSVLDIQLSFPATMKETRFVRRRRRVVRGASIINTVVRRARCSRALSSTTPPS